MIKILVQAKVGPFTSESQGRDMEMRLIFRELIFTLNIFFPTRRIQNNISLSKVSYPNCQKDFCSYAIIGFFYILAESRLGDPGVSQVILKYFLNETFRSTLSEGILFLQVTVKLDCYHCRIFLHSNGIQTLVFMASEEIQEVHRIPTNISSQDL